MKTVVIFLIVRLMSAMNSPMDLNEANKADLISLPGIGNKLAEAILTLRSAEGMVTCAGLTGKKILSADQIKSLVDRGLIVFL